ncbi:energy-coupling factor transporter transmembrane protein EcfT [bacterium]|nr:energy-coupling factor transporter transmembrane protein EcfT [bacterium]
MLVQILTKTTSSVDLTNGFEILLKPLVYLRINTSTISLIFALTLKFIPNLISEYKSIYLAQKSKGSLNNKNKLIAKIKSYTTIIIPLFSLAFEKAENMSDAMLTKGFNFQNKKHYFFKYKLQYFDFIIGSISLAIVIFLIYLIASHTFFGPFGIANSIIINSVQ